MSAIWPHFTKHNPCPACNHWDWNCRAGDKKFICMRVESTHAARDGGWYHDYGDKPKPFIPAPRKPASQFKTPNWQEMNDGFTSCEFGRVHNMDKVLGVSMASIQSLEIGYSYSHKAFTFPMRDGENRIIGIQLRGENKRCVVGSRLGLFIPQIEPQKVCFLPEGASDTAALLTMGFYAIGRPSCNTGGEMIKAALKRLGVHRAVIVSDNDEIKSTGKRPGIEGANKLKKEIGVPSVIWLAPSPIKDVRQFLSKVGPEIGRKIIESDIRSKSFTKP